MANNTTHAQPAVSDFTTISVIVLLATMIAVTLGANAVTFLAILTNRTLRYSPYYFLLSLCVADFMVGLTVLPVSLAYHVTHKLTGRWIFGPEACVAFTFANLFFCSASTLNLCAISWDRYVAVTSPLRYLVRMHREMVFKILILCWISAAVLSAVCTHLVKISSSRDNCSLKEIQLKYSITIAAVLYVLPVGFLVFVNGRVVKIARSQTKRIACVELSLSQATNASTRPPFNKRNTRGRLRTEIKTLRMFLAVTGGFLLCWTPFFFAIATDAVVHVPGFVLYIFIVVAYGNSALNPLLYGVFSKEIRKSISQKLRCNKNQ